MHCRALTGKALQHIIIVMMILAISNQKGGTGKTTTAAALGSILAAEGRTVLLIDLDPQASLTQGLGVEAAGRSMAEVMGGALRGPLGLAEIVQPLRDGLDLAPSDIALSSCELGLTQRLGRENVLKGALARLGAAYELVLIDCPPSLGILTLNALMSARGVIVPSLPSAADLRGVRMFLETLANMQADGLNPDLVLIGVLLTQFDGRTIAHNQALEALRLQRLPLLGAIPRSVKAQEAGAALQSVIDYDPKSKPSEGYYQAAESVKKWLKNNPI